MYGLNIKIYVRVMNMSFAFIYINMLSFILLENTVKTDNIRKVVQNIKYIYRHSRRLCIVKHMYIYLVQVSLPTNFDWQDTWLS